MDAHSFVVVVNAIFFALFVGAVFYGVYLCTKLIAFTVRKIETFFTKGSNRNA